MAGHEDRERNRKEWREEQERRRAAAKEEASRARDRHSNRNIDLAQWCKPRSYTDFVQASLGVSLTPGQTALARVLYDGEQPSGSEVERKILGDVGHIPDTAREVCIIVCGRGSGKSHLFVASRLLHLGITSDLRALAKGEQGFGPIVAPTLDLARQTLRFLRGAVASVPALEARVTADRADDFVLTHPDPEQDGRELVFSCYAASSKGGDIRGRSMFGAALEESAMFRDANYRVNDQDIYTAIEPRLRPGGQIILATTPWARIGLTWDLYNENWQRPTSAVAARAATLTMREGGQDYATVLARYERLKARLPDICAREMDAEFISADASTFFDPVSIDAAVDTRIVLGRKPVPGSSASAGGDFAFRRNSSALVVCHRIGPAYTVADMLELRPTQDHPLRPSEVVAEFAETLKAHGLDMLVSDGHYREAIREWLDVSKIALVDAPTQVSLPYVRARTLFHEGALRIPNDPQLVQQLKETRSRPLSGGGVQIIPAKSPDGRHGDIVSALVLAVWTSATSEVLPALAQPGTQAYEEARVRMFFDRKRAEIRKREEEREADSEWGLFSDSDD